MVSPLRARQRIPTTEKVLKRSRATCTSFQILFLLFVGRTAPQLERKQGHCCYRRHCHPANRQLPLILSNLASFTFYIIATKNSALSFKITFRFQLSVGKFYKLSEARSTGYYTSSAAIIFNSPCYYLYAVQCSTVT